MYLTKRIAVAGRIAVNLRSFEKEIEQATAEHVLRELGFSLASVNVCTVTRGLIGRDYRRGARSWEAPNVFDCSGFTRYCYAQFGLWLPRRSIQQFKYGRRVTKLRPGDLLFTRGWRAYWDERVPDGIGHVGLYVGDGRVVHAANRRLGVVETNVTTFTEHEHYRGAVRIYPNLSQLTTLVLPERWADVETVEDVLWVLRMHKSKDRSK